MAMYQFMKFFPVDESLLDFGLLFLFWRLNNTYKEYFF